MRLGVFTYGMSGRMTGIARYAVELTRALRELEPKLEIILLNPYPESTHPWYKEFPCYPLPQLRLLPWAATLGNVLLHRAALELQLDILHDPCGIAPFLIPTKRYKRVVTVHDAIPFIYPETQPLLTRLIFRTLIRGARTTSDAILTVSESASEDLIRYAKLPPSKVFVTYNGVNAPLEPRDDTAETILSKWGVKPPYFLVVGALHARKNLDRVMMAFAELRAKGVNAQLVITGPPSWGANQTLGQVLEKVRTDPSFIFTGFVSDEELDALYREAQALVFPSLYEGFGLPALEAMARGTAVITSKVSSLPEVVADAGVLVDPTSTNEIATAMERLLTDSELRSELHTRGLERVKFFTWENTAHKTLEVYHKILARE